MLKKYYEQSSVVGVLDTRSYYIPFGDKKDAFGCRKKSSRFIDLDGKWTIAEYDSPLSVPDDFYKTAPDHEKRLIRVAVYAQNGFVMLRFENYCAQEVELGADGLPRRNTHGGSDLRSVRAAAEKRGGTMTLHWENGWFTLRVLLPQKS